MKLTEIIDDEPLLMRLIKQELARGREIWVDIKIPRKAPWGDGAGYWPHVGPLQGISILHQADTKMVLKNITKGESDRCIIITFLAKANRYKKRDVMLNLETFDTTYELRHFGPGGLEEGWTLVNVDGHHEAS